VRRLKKLRAEWEARNYVSLSEAPTDRHGIVKIDADGFVPRRPGRTGTRARAIEQRKAARQRERDLREYNAELKRQAQARKVAIQKWVETGVTAPDRVIDWCVKWGIEPNPDATVTLVKAVRDREHYRSGYNGGVPYVPGTTVTEPNYDRTAACGRGLHFGPNKAVARTYLSYVSDVTEPVYLKVRVPLDTLIPVSDKCKAASCYVEGEIDD
jgi:hypothetical protein